MNASRILTIALSLGLAWGTGPARAQTPDEFYRDNVVVVLDASGSMSKHMSGTRVTRMKAAKEALLAVVDNLQPSSKVGLLVFSGSDRKFSNWVYPLGELDVPKMRRAILGPQPGGGTPLADYMKKGADRLMEEREKQLGYGSFRLLVVTDGIADSGQKVTPYAQEILARGITMDAIGVDMKQDHTLAKLAHSYRRANDPESLKRAVSEVFAEVGGSGGDDQGATEDFELLAALDADLAMTMIQALARSGNHPIGTHAQDPAAQPAQGTGSSQPAKSPSKAAPSQAPSQSSGGGSAKKKSDLDLGVWAGIGLICFLVFGSNRAGKKKR